VCVCGGGVANEHPSN